MRRVMVRLLPLFVCVWIACLAVSAAAQNPGGNPDAKKLKNPVASTPDSIKAGQAAFQKYCRFCHGAEAKGNGTMAPKDTHPSDLTDAKWDRGDSDGEIFTVIKEGAGPKFDMKGFKSKMTDQEIWQVVNYLHSLQGK
jgi:mono/diheme cytochrome c family protein